MFCPKCGAQLKDGAKFCSKCGSGIGASPAPEPKEQQKTKRQEAQAVRPAASVKKQEAATQTPPPPKKNAHTGLIIALLVILLALVLAGGAGAYYFLNSNKDEALLESVRSEFAEEEEEEENPEEKGAAREEEASTEAALAVQAPTTAETTAAATLPVMEPVTASVQYAGQTSLAGLVRAGVVQSTVVESSHIFQAETTIDNSGWSAFDGQSATSWQEGVDGDGIGEYVGIGFDREYQVQVITLLLGNHRSDSWYIKNNTPQTLSINLSGQIFQVTFPKEKVEFAVVLSRPVPASDIRLTIDAVYPGTEYSDTIISEVGVYGN
ncbi:MAG: zinc ribbon domain-containing protein [Clostridium sp.]|nr:zinc ribbon domain-containing protein [Clostridium sp.]